MQRLNPAHCSYEDIIATVNDIVDLLNKIRNDYVPKANIMQYEINILRDENDYLKELVARLSTKSVLTPQPVSAPRHWWQDGMGD